MYSGLFQSKEVSVLINEFHAKFVLRVRKMADFLIISDRKPLGARQAAFSALKPKKKLLLHGAPVSSITHSVIQLLLFILFFFY